MRLLLLLCLLVLPLRAEQPPERRALDLFDLGQGLKAAIKWLDHYPVLESLDMSFNELSRLPRIPYMQGVRSMDLSGNALDHIPQELYGATTLRALDLRGNLLTTLRGVQWAKFRSLDELDLGGNQLTDLGSLRGLEGLVSLDLSDNQLKALPPEIGRLKSLRRLDLSRNQLTTLPPELGKLTALEELTLSGNPLVSLHPAIGRLTSLRRLDIEDTTLKSFPDEMGRLTRLVTFSCPGCNAPIPNSFKGMRSLKWIYVGNLSPEELVRLENLLPWAEVIPIP